MKKLLFSLLLVATFSSLLAQKTFSDENAEKRTVGTFHGINVGTGIKLVMTEGTSEEVAVSAATVEFRDRIVTEVKGGILKIYYENKLNAINKKKEKKDLKAYVSYKMLDELNANTGARVQIEGTLKATTLKMNANTGATIKGTVNISDLDVDQNTGSVITLTGDAAKITIDGDTGSTFEGIALKSDNCSATVSTGAGIYITVQKQLNVRANTGGYLKYKGDSANKDVRVHTGGSVSKI
jgi:hypothetical protein